MKKIFTLLLLFCASLLSAQTFVPTTTLMPWNATWKWKNNSVDLDSAWRASNYVDTAFSSGPAPLGYGSIDPGYFGLIIPAQSVSTTIGTAGASSTGTNTATFYFRSTFSISTSSTYSVVQFKLRVDDGCAIYLNGQIISTTMTKYATASTTNSTVATSTVALPFQLSAPWSYTSMTNAQTTDGQDLFTFTLSTTNTLLVNGTNTIAVEVHNRANNSSDILWAMQLEGGNIGTPPPPVLSLVKGPYLQIGTQNSMVVRWETNFATDSKVMYGTNAASLTSTATNTVSSVTHTVQLSNLSAYTKYYYSIGSATYVVQGDTNNFFLTSPVPGTPGKYRFWVVGDCGNASSNQINCKNQFISYNGNKPVNGMLLSGDNAYSSGTDAEYNAEFFGIYSNDALKKMPLWSAPGNHDYNNGASTATTVTYFSKFMGPTAGEAGGVASGNPAYYSFDYGNIHFLSLDSYGTTGSSQKMYDTTGAQVTWIKQDLAANTKKWTIAYWHHPPYTMGSHNSDTESDLVAIRQKFIKILERNKVDMIICGHSHDYERSKLMNGHYGSESTFSATVHNLSTSSGKYDGSTDSCPYTKDSTQNAVGTVYVLSGSAGQLGGQQSSFPHDAMYYSNATNGGTFILDIEDNKLDAKWICADGAIRDQFSMFKDVKAKKSYTVLPGQTATLTASWPGTFTWGNSATTRTLAVSAIADSTIWVKDPNSCVADTFKLKVLPSVNFTMSTPYCVATPVSFSNLSTNNTTAWHWSVIPSAGAVISSSVAQNPTITFNASGIYTVSLISENAYGAGTVTNKTISVNANPVVSSASSPTVICANQSATLSASGANSYSWSSGSTSSLVPVSPTTTSVYTVTGTDANGCTANSVQTLIVNALPSVSVVSNPTSAVICAGGTLSLSGAGASTYSWSNGLTNGASFTLNANATYTLYGTDANGCQKTATVSVLVNALPSLSVVSSPSSAMVCNGASISITASGASTYSWNAGFVNGASFAPSASTVYTVTGTDNNGCKNTLTQSVTVNALPTLSISGSSALCIGQTLSLTASGAATYSWNTSANTTVIAVSPSVTTTYTLTGTDANACQNIATKTVVVNALPSVSISGNSVVCLGSALSLTASGASSYSWSTNASANVISVSPTLGTTYTVNGSDANGCQNTATVAVAVNAIPTLSLVSSPLSAVVCNGASLSITASGASTYTWSAGFINGVSFTPSASAVYTVTGMGSNGCVSTLTQSVTVNALPVVSISGSNAVCLGSFLTLSASGATSYSWSTNATTNSISVNPTSATSYTVSGTDANGCVDTEIKVIAVNALPLVSLSGNMSLCAGETTTVTAIGASTYSWSNASTTATLVIAPSANANYTVTGTDVNGCKNIAFTTFTIHALPLVTASSNATLICAGESATLTVAGASSYMWNTNATSNTVVVSPVTNTTYSVTGKNLDNCSASASIVQNVSACTGFEKMASEIQTLIYPNPNKGAFNIELNTQGNFNAYIFNALGERVYSAKLENGITHIELNQTKGIYFYVILNDSQILERGKIIIE